MPARHLVLGLDGADLDVVRALGATRLPALFGLMARGAYARCESVQPPATLPNWTTFLTGLDPGRHGVFDFTTRVGTRVRFTGGTVRAAPTVAARLDALGKTCAVIGFPATWPPERLAHGVFVSGWDSPVAFEADASFVWPTALHAELTTRFGPLRFDDAGETDADAPGWHARLPAVLTARVERKTALALHLLEGRDWDLFAAYFGESDTASHHLWALHDPHSPRHPRTGALQERNGLTAVYESLDRAVARLVQAAGSDAEVTVISDHGSGGSSDVVLHLNRALADARLLTFEPGAKAGSSVFGMLKDTALRRLPPKLRERVFHAAGRALPGWLESRARFGAIDFSRTLAFSDELNYFPAIHLNLAEREPRGIVSARGVESVVHAVQECLMRLRDPWSGQQVVLRVDRREALYSGPYVSRAPELLLTLALREGYSYNVQPSGGPGPVFTRLEPHEYLGRKGRSLGGSHRSHGLYIAAGPQVRAAGEVSMRIADATATLLARMGLDNVPEGAGRALDVLQTTEPSSLGALPDAPESSAPPESDEALVEARLRALGYVD